MDAAWRHDSSPATPVWKGQYRPPIRTETREVTASGHFAPPLNHLERYEWSTRSGEYTRAMRLQSIGNTSRGITATVRSALEEDDDGKWSVGFPHATNSTFDSTSREFCVFSNTPTREASRVNSRNALKSPRKNVSF
jgi:hypothetical protein